MMHGHEKSDLHLVRVALVFNTDNASAAGYWRSIETVAKSRNVIPISLPVRDIASILDAVDAFAREPNGGLVLPTDATTIVNRDLIVALAARHRLPALYSFRSDVASGGRVRSRPISRCKRRPNTSWSSIGRQRRRSASKSPRRCSPAPTR